MASSAQQEVTGTTAPVTPAPGIRRTGPDPARASRARRRGDGPAAALFLAPGLLGFTAFIVVPLLGSAAISLFNWPLFGTPEFVGIANYVRMFTGDPTFYTVLGNTLVFAVVYTVLNLLLALAVALWLNSGVMASGLFRVVFFLPVITPMVANALVWRLMLSEDGVVNGLLATGGITGPNWLSDSRWALLSVIAMSVWQSFGYNVIVLGAGLAAIPKEILEAARVDGAGAWRRLRSIVLPMISPSMFFASIMTMIGAFQVFAQPQVLTEGGPGEATNTMVLHLYRNGFSFDRLGYASALAWILFVIVMLVTALQFVGQRRWVNYDQ